MWGFQEKVAPGAFKNALKKSDTRALFNHDPNIILGRTSAKTLELKEDKQGLHMTVTPPDTNYVRDVVLTPIKRGDIKEQSFAFTVKKDSWEEDKEKQIVTRTIMEIEELYDVSPVTFPAYADTTVAVRSMEEWRKAAVGSQPPDSGATPGDGIPGDGAIPDGWEKVTSEDVTDGLRRLHIIKTKLKRMEVLEL
jgi:HK97 family phage prohead protease